MPACLTWLALLILLGLLSACGTRRPAPVEERGGWRPAPVTTRPANHTVVRGDTMYSIAFRYGLDWRELAAWNGIGAPYLIHPGDRLRLTAPLRRTRQAARRAVPVTDRTSTTGQPATGSASSASSRRGTGDKTTAKPQPDSSAARTTAPATTSKSAKSQAAKPPAPKAQSSQAPSKKAAPDQSPPPSKPPPKSTASAATKAGVRWRWPAAGAVVHGFNPNNAGRQGVDIRGQLGETVVAAADGTVVYSGTGLIGYGELIIIKHNDRLLSAYGHNRRRLVKEGDAIKAGQPISEMGRNSSGDVLLHFEIRVEGKPQNPLNFLPKR